MRVGESDIERAMKLRTLVKLCLLTGMQLSPPMQRLFKRDTRLAITEENFWCDRLVFLRKIIAKFWLSGDWLSASTKFIYDWGGSRNISTYAPIVSLVRCVHVTASLLRQTVRLMAPGRLSFRSDASDLFHNFYWVYNFDRVEWIECQLSNFNGFVNKLSVQQG